MKKPIQEGQTFHYEPAVKVSPTPGIKRTAAYCRVSTLYEEQELSFESQKDFYLNYINADSGMMLAGIYGDQGFFGLGSRQRKEFQRLMEDCEAGKIDQILVKSVSRFSRNTSECMKYLHRLKELGIGVFFEKEGLNSLDPRMEMILGIYASIAQNESCALSENVRWAKHRMAELGDPDRMARYGYRKEKTGSQHKWIIHEEEAKRVRLMFQWAYQGYSTAEITRMLNDYETKHGGDPSWKTWRVIDALRHEAYKGDLLTNKSVVLDYVTGKCVRNNGFVDQFYLEQHHDPIVEPSVYEAIQDYMNQGLLNNRNTKKRAAWFEEHPEILDRRNKSLIEEEKGEKTA